jgi:hypothetical protein
MTSPTPILPSSPGADVAQDYFTSPDADGRDLTPQQVSSLKVELDGSLFLFSRMICGYRDLTPGYHGPICEFLDNWGRTDLPGGSPYFGWKRLMLQISRDTFKCYTSECMLQTSEGPKRAGDIKVGDLLDTPTGYQPVLANEPGEARLVRVTLKTGREATVTPNHPFLTTHGWSEIGDLAVGSAIATAQHFTPPQNSTYEFPYTAGALCGDGCHSSHTITCFDREIISAIRDEGVTVKARNVAGVYGIPKETWEVVEIVGIAPNKCIPRKYEGSVDFLRGLFDTDGTVYPGGKRGRNAEVGFSTTSSQLLDDVVRNLHYLGITSRWGYYESQGPDDYRGYFYALRVSGLRNLELFQKYIGFEISRKQLRLQSAIDHLRGATTSSRDESVPKGWTNHLTRRPRGYRGGFGDLRKLKEAGIRISEAYWTTKGKFRQACNFLGRNDLLWMASFRWDEIVSIEPVNDGEIAQIEVEGGCYYDASGILSHNTSVGTIANALQKVARSEGGMATVGIFNAKESRTFAWVRTIREVVESSRVFQAVYRDVLPPGVGYLDRDKGKSIPQRWRWSDHAIDLQRDRGLPEASISGHGATGSAAGWHFDYVIKDDLIEVKHAQSEVEMNRVWDWCETARYLEKPAEKGNELWNYTRWHYNDIYAQARRQWPDDYVVFHRQILENHPETGEEYSTFPERFTTEELQRERASRPFYFAAQRQNVPKAGKEQSFDTEWLRYGHVDTTKGEWVFVIDSDFYDPKISEIDLEKDEGAPKVVPLAWMEKCLLWDPAPSEQSDRNRERNARNGLAMVGKDPWGRLFVLSAKGYQLDPEEMMRLAIRDCLHWGSAKAAVEEVNFSKVYKHFARYLMRKEFPKDHITFIPQKAEKQSKDARIMGLIPDFRSGFVYLNEPACRQLVQEYTEYPYGTTRDIMDALAQHKKCVFRPLTVEESLELSESRANRGRRPGQLDAVNWGG